MKRKWFVFNLKCKRLLNKKRNPSRCWRKHLGGLDMGLTNIRLGDYIERSTINNKELKYGVDLIVGVNSQGVFTAPKGNTDGVDLKPYKIVENGAFVYNPTRLELGSIAYRTERLCIVSHLYMVFYLTDEGKKIIDPMWLYIYFRRSEFCREVKFRNFGSQRPEFNFNDMSDIVIPLPDIEIQKKYVDIYNAMLENQKSYEYRLEDLKLACDASKEFREPTSKVNRNELSNYKIVRPRQISFVQTTHNEKVFAYAFNNTEDDIVVTSVNEVFSVDEDKLLPEYLCMFFNRTEFDRYARFHSWGSARETFTWDIKL